MWWFAWGLGGLGTVLTPGVALQLVVINATSGEVLTQAQVSNNWIYACDAAFPVIVAAGVGGVCKFFDYDGNCTRDMRDNNDYHDIFTALMSDDASKMYTASKSGACTVYDTATGDTLHTILDHHKAVYHCQADPMDRLLYTSGADYCVRGFDLRAGRPVSAETKMTTSNIARCVYFDEYKVMCGDYSGLVYCWCVACTTDRVA